ncbi:MAG: hypothetical protein Q7W54_01390 [Bacteroidota bacterium]|nr:hypothetical protein [Bacteroidota bacterium]
MAETIQFELNGKKVEIPLEKNQTLLWALRINFNLTLYTVALTGSTL